jgi:iron complex outermembrane recepter protein
MDMKLNFRRCVLLGTTAFSANLVLSNAALAQSDGEAGLQEIIVTAQKREQILQDVPIAITAIGGETLEANRVVSVTDLSGLAPGLTTMPTPGGSQTPQFSMRGTTGNGSVQGSDRGVGIYIDGVYIAASRGAIFDLPDIQRIEVLRGPQGTLFGRNSTAGAVSIITRDPTGEIGVKATATVGNRDEYRFGVSVDLPQVGPFSGYVSYLHSERRGDIRNTAPGILWDRRSAAIPRIARVLPSARYLGSHNADNWFAALKFESGDFTTVYKYDRFRSTNTADATGAVGFPTTGTGALTGSLLTALVNSQSFPVPITPNGRRPDAVANGFVVEGPQHAEGHNLTSTYQISDNLSIKNIFAYRKSFIFATAPLDGLSSLTLTPQALGPLATFYGISGLARQGINVADPANAALVQATIRGIATGLQPALGSPFLGIASASEGRTKQISDELQLNYDSKRLTATVGALWFNAKDHSNEHLQQNASSFTVYPGGVITNTNFGRTFNEVTSMAAYAQVEFHASEQLDFIVGGRFTRDKKDGSLFFGPNLNASRLLVADTYKKSKFNYLLGVNFKPNADTLLYAKYSTAYVSGGSTSGITYSPETVKSWEAGAKATLFDRRLQANLALYHVKYHNIQGANSTTTPGLAEVVNQITGDPNRANVITVFTFNNGDLKAKGFEFDFTAAPVERLTFGGSLGYTDPKFSNVNPLVLAANGGIYQQILVPKWTANVWAQYNTQQLVGDAYLSFRVDGRWQSDMNLNANPNRPEYQTWAAGVREVPAYWVFNGRVALRDFDLGGVKTEIAAWGRNLTDNRSARYVLNLGFIAGANYIPARSYGVDMTIRF